MDEGAIETETVDCLLCRSKRNRLFLETDNIRRGTRRYFRVVECLDCGFRFTNPRPTKESMKRYYEGYESLAPKKIGFVEKAYYAAFRGVAGSRGKKLLDIGCGNGKYLYFMKDSGCEVYGQDVNPTPDFLKKDLKVYEGELYDVKIPDESFDVITSWWSIEHMEDPLRSMQECRRILKKGGLLLVATSNSDSLEARLFKRYWHHLAVPEHYSQFTDATLKALLEKAGFAVEKVGHDLLTFGFVNSFQHYLTGKGSGLKVSNPLTKLLSMPLDFAASALGKSGLITLRARKA